jgi:hypothetical protein
VIVLYRPARRGRRVAYLTVIGFIFLVLMLSVGLFVESPHWRRAGSGRVGEGEIPVQAARGFAISPLQCDNPMFQYQFCILYFAFCNLQSSSNIPALSFIYHEAASGCCQNASGLNRNLPLSPSHPLSLSASVPLLRVTTAGGRSC